MIDSFLFGDQNMSGIEYLENIHDGVPKRELEKSVVTNRLSSKNVLSNDQEMDQKLNLLQSSWHAHNQNNQREEMDQG